MRFCALQVDGDLLRRRVQSREGHFMPASLLASQLDLLEPLAADEPGVQVDASGEVAVVVRRALASLGLPQNRDATP